MKTLDALKQAFRNTSQSSSRSSNYYPFHQMSVDSTAVIRFLPDKSETNQLQFLVEKITHALDINGNRTVTPCLSMYDEPCIICETSQKFYKANNKIEGKKYWKQRQHIGQILVIKDPLSADPETGENHEGKVRIIGLGFQLFGIIKNAFESGDFDEVPFAYKGGYNFNIKKTQQGDYPNYTLGSNFARKQSDLDDDTIAIIEQEIVDLSTLLPKHPGVEKTEALLNAALTGEEYHDSSDSNDSTAAFRKAMNSVGSKPADEQEEEPALPESEEEDIPPVVSTKPKTTPQAVSEPEEDTSTDDILAKIRSRRKVKAT